MANYGASAGSQTQADGTRAPQWIWYPSISIQVQPLSRNDLKKLDGLNLQEDTMAVYLNGVIDGVRRLTGRGGDMLQFPIGVPTIAPRNWLVTGVIENWDVDGWSKIAVTQQVNNT